MPLGGAMTAAAVVAAVTGVGKAIAGVKDMKLRADIERNIKFLSQKQQIELDRQLQNAATQDKKTEILVNAVSKIRGGQSAAIITATIQARKADQVKQERTNAIIVIGGAVAIMIAIYLLKKK
jgi:hypothetical protein